MHACPLLVYNHFESDPASRSFFHLRQTILLAHRATLHTLTHSDTRSTHATHALTRTHIQSHTPSLFQQVRSPYLVTRICLYLIHARAHTHIHTHTHISPRPSDPFLTLRHFLSINKGLPVFLALTAMRVKMPNPIPPISRNTSTANRI